MRKFFEVVQSLTRVVYDVSGKQQVTIRCTADGCDETREVFTSDLFQVRMCQTHADAARKAKKAAKKAEAKAAAQPVAVTA